MKSNPLVSCVMPTAGRPKFVAHAIEQFLQQDYDNKELIILGDATMREADVVNRVARNQPIKYRQVVKGCTLGRKRNIANEISDGDLIMHWDDDDWMSSSRISRQVTAMRKVDAEVSGMEWLMFYDLRNGEIWEYEYGGDKPWLAGGTLCYTREFWKRKPFADIQEGSDTQFIWGQSLKNAVPINDLMYIATIHDGNTSPKDTRLPWWKRLDGAVPRDVVEMRELIH